MAYLSLVLEPCFWIKDPQEPVTANSHDHLLVSIKPRHHYGRGISDTSLGPSHLLDLGIILAPVKENWMSLLSHHVHMVLIELALQYLREVQLSKLVPIFRII